MEPAPKRRKLAVVSYFATRNGDYKAPSSLPTDNLKYWYVQSSATPPSHTHTHTHTHTSRFWRTVRTSAAEDGKTRLKYLKPVDLLSTKFAETRQTQDLDTDTLIEVTATKEGDGVVTIACGAEVDNPHEGDAATKARRSELLSWNADCEGLAACSKFTELRGCIYCNYSFCDGCRAKSGAVLAGNSIVCKDCAQELPQAD